MAEQRRIDDALVAATQGSGTALLVVGEPGAGKSALIEHAVGVASGPALRAAGGEFEQALPLAVARQLLPVETRATTDPFGVAQALHAELESRAAAGPLLVAVDDLQWADDLSLRWLVFTARRLRELPVLLLATMRDATSALLDAFAREATRVSLGPLAPASVGALVRRHLGLVPDDVFTQRLHHLTGGNAFFVTELLRVAADTGMRPDANAAAALDDLAPAGVLAMARLALRRADADGSALARAAAVLGPEATPERAGTIAGMGPASARTAAELLRQAGLLLGDDLQFAHPLLRTAVLETLAPHERTRLHLAAARALEASGAGALRVASHIREVGPGSDAWAVDVLRQGAQEAATSGAPETAVALLRRALAEPPDAADADAVRLELGRVLLDVDPAAAAVELDAVRTGRGGSLLIEIARARYAAHDIEGAIRAVQEAAGQDDPVGDVAAERFVYELFSDGERDRAQARLRVHAATAPHVGPALRIALAVAELFGGTADGVRRELAHVGEAQLATLAQRIGSPVPMWVPYLWLEADEPERAQDLLEGWARAAATAGAPTRAAFAHAVLAEARFRIGNLREAEADAVAAWNVAADLGPGFVPWWVALAGMMQAQTARGDLSAAQASLEAAGLDDAPIPDFLLTPPPRMSRARLRIAQGRADEGVAELLAAGRWLESRLDPIGLAWRSDAAEALAQTGDPSSGRALAAEELARARSFGSPVAEARALRAMALCSAEPEREPALAESCALLAATGARYERARSRLELGAHLRRSGARVTAREHLRSALDDARANGAQLLAERAAEELAAAGGRPRPALATGVDALTPSELRVARLAAIGLSNPEIAQRLYVTRKTVEKHLGNAFMKLDVKRRTELAEALAPQE